MKIDGDPETDDEDHSDSEDTFDYSMHKISALTHARMKSLVKDEYIQLSMFDEKTPIEVSLPDQPYRYALSLNPVRAEKEKRTRLALIEKTKREIDEIAHPVRKVDQGTLGIRVGRVLKGSKVAKYFDITISDMKIEYTIKEDLVRDDELWDGHYVIFTDVKKEDMPIGDVVNNYRALIHVEQAFRNLKSPIPELRPVYHHRPDRIRCHVFLCMLAYYLVWHMKKSLQPLFDEDGQGRARKYTIHYILETLRSITKNKIQFDNATTCVISDRNQEQQRIVDLLGVKF